MSAASELWIYRSLSRNLNLQITMLGTSPPDLPCSQWQHLIHTTFPQLPLADCVRAEKEGVNLKQRHSLLTLTLSKSWN